MQQFCTQLFVFECQIDLFIKLQKVLSFGLYSCKVHWKD